MANRTRKGRAVSGWLVLDKPAGMTSTQAVSVVKRLFNAKKAGHAGTLDPLASGCLPIGLGEATKAMPQVTDAAKTYRFTISWGSQTDTDDAEGKVVRASEARPTAADIAAALPEFTGEIEQVPPAYSAIKISGERAYDLARSGEDVTLEPRVIAVERFDLIAAPDPDHADFEIRCGKGTYVRSIARDLGIRLGCYGHVSALRRVATGPFGEEDMVPLAAVREAVEAGGPEAADEWLQPVEAVLSDLTPVVLRGQDAGRVLRGQAVLLRGAKAPLPGPAYATGGGQLLAVGEVEAGAFHPKRVFNL
jgi:tRNA pseudouridine55 synthase